MSNENENTLKDFVRDLSEDRTLEVVKSGRNYNVKINSEKVDLKYFDKLITQLLRSSPQFRKYNELLLYKYPTSAALFEDFKREVQLFTVDKYRKENVEGIHLTFDFTPYIPLIALDSHKKVLLFNMEENQVDYDLAYESYKMLPKALQKDPIFGVIQFDPYNPEKKRPIEYKGQKVWKINTYNCPEWQYDRTLSLEERKTFSSPPDIIKRFMDTLFPSQESREFVLDWLHFALTKRCETYLVLNGAKGIGKGIFTDYLCKQLIGPKNWNQAAPGALESNFNAMLVGKRMIVFDEMPINDTEKIAKLKKYINKDQAIEFKGEDVGDTIETYNSFVISSNNLTDIRIDWDDRRFSVMDISEKKLNEQWMEGDINLLIESLEDIEIIRQFGYWLMYRKPKGNEFSVFKGEHFWKLCYTSLPEWSKTIIDECMKGIYEEIDRETLVMALRDRNAKLTFPQNIKVEDFIRNYKHKGIYPLGEYEKTENGSFVLKVSDHFCTTRDNTGYSFTHVDDLL